MSQPQVVLCITGGPSGGKTTLIEALQKELASQVAIVPEAASILYRGGFPRRSRTSATQKNIQKAIYSCQKELEDIVKFENPDKLIVCDRGSLDAIAYWPEKREDFFANINSTEQLENSRYDFLLHLDTADDEFYQISSVRTENHNEAIELNRRVKEAWKSHPQIMTVSHHQDFFAKMALAMKVVKGLLNGLSHSEILRELDKVK